MDQGDAEVLERIERGERTFRPGAATEAARRSFEALVGHLRCCGNVASSICPSVMSPKPRTARAAPTSWPGLVISPRPAARRWPSSAAATGAPVTAVPPSGVGRIEQTCRREPETAARGTVGGRIAGAKPGSTKSSPEQSI